MSGRCVGAAENVRVAVTALLPPVLWAAVGSVAGIVLGGGVAREPVTGDVDEGGATVVLGTVATGVVTLGLVTGVVTAGVVTAGVVTVGVVTAGVVATGVVTGGTVMVGTVTVGVVIAGSVGIVAAAAIGASAARQRSIAGPSNRRMRFAVPRTG